MDDEVLQNLLRSAYQSELPSEDAAERFIGEFHRRQALLKMEKPFLNKIQEQLTNFFSFFRIPALAYAGVTAIAIFISVLILRSPRLNHQPGMNSLPVLSESWETSFNYISSPSLQQKIEPVTFDLKKKRDENDCIIDPLSYILKRKPSLKDF